MPCFRLLVLPNGAPRLRIMRAAFLVSPAGPVLRGADVGLHIFEPEAERASHPHRTKLAACDQQVDIRPTHTQDIGYLCNRIKTIRAKEDLFGFFPDHGIAPKRTVPSG